MDRRGLAMMNSNQKGFTLIEIMIAMVIFGVIIAGVMTSRTTQQEQNVTQLQAVEMQQRARAAMFLMKKELRQAGFNNLATDYGQGVTQANKTSITFSYVTDDIGTLDTIIYSLTDRDADGDTDLARTLNGGLDTLAENITAPADGVGDTALFEFYDGSDPPVYMDPDDAGFNPADIRMVEIRVIALTDVAHRAAADAANATRALTTQVLLRNMGI